MAIRGRRVPGNRFASRLRDLELKTRPGTSRGYTGAMGPLGPPGPEGLPGADGAIGPMGLGVKGWTTVTTDGTGTATWVFPWAPVVVVMAATTESVTPVIVTISALTTAQATVAAWTVGGLPVVGALVHLAAFA